MKAIPEIRKELDEASERRVRLWEELSVGLDPAKSAEAAALSGRIAALWAELRAAQARARFGPAEDIIARARAEDRLDRESRRLREAA
ncbi:MAG: hypothetical protein M3312_10825 [Actinomycetota bacterium]|nr:hypothetical protein [Actinomycetota bacterium]